ncbi:uncharacterized protein LOC123682471 isoform X11 [Harmonia axyridis]|uniref:uncharacterized protein LOC123682471 isoform X11 n=1 Tax=Harmonia axyridis TaxID=115357 RepID=UPI001E277805|nr:uncharacterized protein LOC123682471 isoform X11 [Harmonia axyridis]
MKVFSILLILLLAYIAVSDASPSPQSPDTDGMVEGDSQSRLKRGVTITLRKMARATLVTILPVTQPFLKAYDATKSVIGMSWKLLNRIF